MWGVGVGCWWRSLDLRFEPEMSVQLFPELEKFNSGSVMVTRKAMGIMVSSVSSFFC